MRPARQLCLFSCFVLFWVCGGIVAGQEHALHADIRIRSVRYLPAEEGPFAGNEVENLSPALGGIYTNEEIVDLYRAAVRDFLRDYRVVMNSEVVLDVTIEGLAIEWRGFASRNVHASVSYEVERNAALIERRPYRSNRHYPVIQGTESALAEDFGLIFYRLLTNLDAVESIATREGRLLFSHPKRHSEQ